MNALSEVEEIGLSVVAAIRSGRLKGFDCSKCSESMQEARNCTMEDREDPVYYDKRMGEFYACPIKCIPEVVFDFLDEYRYIKTFPSTASKYDEVNPRFWSAVKFFEDELNYVEEDKTDKTDDSLTRMKGLFKKE